MQREAQERGRYSLREARMVQVVTSQPKDIFCLLIAHSLFSTLCFRPTLAPPPSILGITFRSFFISSSLNPSLNHQFSFSVHHKCPITVTLGCGSCNKTGATRQEPDMLGAS